MGKCTQIADYKLLERVFYSEKTTILSRISPGLSGGLHLDSLNHEHQLGPANHRLIVIRTVVEPSGSDTFTPTNPPAGLLFEPARLCLVTQ